MGRHLDCKAFSLLVWVKAADEQYQTKKKTACSSGLSLNVYIAIYAIRW
jgi:hypothetical protein